MPRVSAFPGRARPAFRALGGWTGLRIASSRTRLSSSRSSRIVTLRFSSFGFTACLSQRLSIDRTRTWERPSVELRALALLTRRECSTCLPSTIRRSPRLRRLRRRSLRRVWTAHRRSRTGAADTLGRARSPSTRTSCARACRSSRSSTLRSPVHPTRCVRPRSGARADRADDGAATGSSTAATRHAAAGAHDAAPSQLF